MRKPTGQMQEETQEKLDGFNLLYNCEYNEMCDFIESHGEETFRDHYETYHRLVDEYGMELVNNFADHFDIETVEHFEEMYQGQHETGSNFAEHICEELGYIRDLPAWRHGIMHYHTITLKLTAICLITLMVTYSETVGKVSTNCGICI